MAAGDRRAARLGGHGALVGLRAPGRSPGLRWVQHPLCPYLPDWVSGLWSVLYPLPPAARPPWPGQTGWWTRLLTAAAARLAAKTIRCDHARDGGQAISWLLNHPDDHTRTGGAS